MMILAYPWLIQAYPDPTLHSPTIPWNLDLRLTFPMHFPCVSLRRSCFGSSKVSYGGDCADMSLRVWQPWPWWGWDKNPGRSRTTVMYTVTINKWMCIYIYSIHVACTTLQTNKQYKHWRVAAVFFVPAGVPWGTFSDGLGAWPDLYGTSASCMCPGMPC